MTVRLFQQSIEPGETGSDEDGKIRHASAHTIIMLPRTQDGI